MAPSRYNLRSSKKGKGKTIKKKESSGLTRIQEVAWSKIMKSIADEVPTPLTIVMANVPFEVKKDAAKKWMALEFETMGIIEKFELIKRMRSELRIDANQGISDVDQLDRLRLTAGEQLAPRSLESDYELIELQNKILSLNASDKIKIELLKKVEEMRNYTPPSDTRSSIRSTIDIALRLPYNTTSVSDTPSSPPEFNEWLSRARKLLDERLFGMENVKEELLIAAANRFTSPNAFVSIALEGPPGVGKTAIASVFAEIMNLPFERISLGGIDDSSILKGSNTQWVGSRPSTILETLGRFKVSNGVILFDEIDKIGDTPRGHEVVGALIHITDYTQNNEFRDAFISEFTHDISKLWFMFSMNDSSALNPILRDRLHIIKLDAYTANELKTIFRQYVFPRALCNVGIDAVTASQITVSDDALDSLISREMNNKTKTGVRHIERHARTIASRINFLLQLKTECVTVKPKFFIENFSLPRELSRKDIETFIGPAPQKEVLSYFI